MGALSWLMMGASKAGNCKKCLRCCYLNSHSSLFFYSSIPADLYFHQRSMVFGAELLDSQTLNLLETWDVKKIYQGTKVP